MLKHNGVSFPPPYGSGALRIRIRGSEVKLTPEQEEMASAWVKKRGTPYVQDPVFTSNFLTDFLKTFPPEYSDAKMDEIDFSDFIRVQDEEKARLPMPEEKRRLREERKKTRLEMKEMYGYAEIDGTRVEVANWMVEPPGLFIGRGEHPLRGRWKPRIYPQDVTLNMGEDAPVPPGDWARIVHEHDSMWLASWVDKLTGKVKYVWPSDTASLRQMRERVKYDVAKKLENHIGKVRSRIGKGLKSGDEGVRKIAAVCYLIDKLCMRVGDEKDEDEADTVGASTLRVEHVTFTPKTIGFDFLGKDSVRWQKSIEVDDDASRIFADELKSLVKRKDKSDPIFDGIRSTQVNRFLGRVMKGLTAKVFRTYHATKVVKEDLSKYGDCRDEVDLLKMYYAKKANLKAAIRCNHKRTPPKNWELSLARKEERLARLMNQTAKTERAKTRLENRVLKVKLAIRLAKETRDYNLNTSLRSYIDPRVYRAWSDYAGLDWKATYPKTLQRKFSWVNRARFKWG